MDLMNIWKFKSRSKSTKNEEVKEWVIVNESSSINLFKGYDDYELETKVFKYRECITIEGETQYLVTNETLSIRIGDMEKLFRTQ